MKSQLGYLSVVGMFVQIWQNNFAWKIISNLFFADEKQFRRTLLTTKRVQI